MLENVPVSNELRKLIYSDMCSEYKYMFESKTEVEEFIKACDIKDYLYFIHHVKELQTQEVFEAFKEINPDIDDIFELVLNYKVFQTQENFDYIKTFNPTSVEFAQLMVDVPKFLTAYNFYYYRYLQGKEKDYLLSLMNH